MNIELYALIEHALKIEQELTSASHEFVEAQLAHETAASFAADTRTRFLANLAWSEYGKTEAERTVKLDALLLDNVAMATRIRACTEAHAHFLRCKAVAEDLSTRLSLVKAAFVALSRAGNEE